MGRLSGCDALMALSRDPTATVFATEHVMRRSSGNHLGRCKHTSSMYHVEFYNKVAKCIREPSVGLVAAQQMKLLNVALKNGLETEKAVYWQAFN